jgi:multidrug efflux pump
MLPNEIFIMTDKDQGGKFAGWFIDARYLSCVVILLIYIVLGVTYESLIHPLTILSTVPTVALGALLTLWLFNFQFTLIALLGMFLLIGIVVKNAILLIDFTLLERRAGKTAYQAILSATLHSVFVQF